MGDIEIIALRMGCPEKIAERARVMVKDMECLTYAEADDVIIVVRQALAQDKKNRTIGAS